MPGDEFFKTRMGQRFYEATMPKIADQLERLNANLKALAAELRRQRLSGQDPVDAVARRPAAVDRDE
jgi:hypothetical protein